MPGLARTISRPQVAATLALSGIAGLTLAASGDWKVPLGLFLTGVLVGLGFLRPALFLSGFLLLRPLVDQLSGNVAAGGTRANIAGALGVLLVAVSIVVFVGSRKRFAPAGTKGLVAVLFASAVAAIDASLNLSPAISLEPASELVRLAALLAVYMLGATLFGTPDRARRLFVLVALSALVPAIWGIVELILGPEIPEESGAEIARVSGPFVGPSGFGGYLALTTLIMIFLPRGAVPGWVRIGGLVAMLVPLTATYSRMGWVMLLIGAVALGWRDRKGVVVASLCVATVLCVAIPTVRERALPIGSTSSTSSSGDKPTYESLNWRIGNWRDLLVKWTERPLIGYGLESTAFVNERKRPGLLDQPDGGYAAHNIVVRVLLEGGIVLLAAFLLFLGAVLRATRRLAKERWPLASLGRLLFVLWVVVIFAGLTTDDPFSATALMYALLALTGALEGAWHSQLVLQQARSPGRPEPAAPVAPPAAGRGGLTASPR